jgi:hypothetical protein
MQNTVYGKQNIHVARQPGSQTVVHADSIMTCDRLRELMSERESVVAQIRIIQFDDVSA